VASFGIGTLAGSLAAIRLNRARRPAVAACIVFLIQASLIALLPWAPGCPWR
jgi:predicted MFS family arabinose efflux permease